MEVWTKEQDVPLNLRSALTIGIFDGVHRGHQAILAQTVELARKSGLTSVVLTFDPHPVSVHQPEKELKLITSLAERLELIAASGIDAVYIQHYDLEYAQTAPEDFLAEQVCDLLKAKAVIVGKDVHFGKNNSGDGELLQRVSAVYGFQVFLLEDIGAGDIMRWSSTEVRKILAAGDVEMAAEILGRPHRVQGIVQHGNKRGRLLGVPTANLIGNEIGEIPADGVYAGWVVRKNVEKEEERFPAAISVGTNPQFKGKIRTVEAHILGRTDLNLYGTEITVEFISYLRPMLSFAGIDELQIQMDLDIQRSAQILRVANPGRVDPAAVTAK